MAYDVARPNLDTIYRFHVAIPQDSDTWVRIGVVRAAAQSYLEKELSPRYVYRLNELVQDNPIGWNQIKFDICWLTHIEANFHDSGKPIFPKRKVAHQEVSSGEFEAGWNRLLPLEITDEWAAAVLSFNPIWFEMLKPWMPSGWLEKWMPEKIKEEEYSTLGEDLEPSESL